MKMEKTAMYIDELLLQVCGDAKASMGWQIQDRWEGVFRQ